MDDDPGRIRDWSSLPADILSVLLQRLDNTDTDCRRLRAVCTSWRSSLTPPLQLLFPLEVMLPKIEIDSSVLDSVRLSFPNLVIPESVGDLKKLGYMRQTIFYLISLPDQNSSSSSSSSSSSRSSSSTWLTRVEETVHLNPDLCKTWKLQNPMSCVCDFKQLPELKTQVNLFEFRISEVARSYYLPRGRGSFSSIKTAMLLCPNSQHSDADFSYLTLSTRDLSSNQDLMLLMPGAEEWVKIDTDTVNDILAYQQKFYAVDFRGKLIAINPVTSEVKVVIKSQFEQQNCDGLYCYLLESCGKLYLVQKAVHHNFFYNDRFDEYEVDYENGKPLEIKVFTLASSGDIGYYWEPVTSVGDRVFFVMTMSTSLYLRMKLVAIMGIAYFSPKKDSPNLNMIYVPMKQSSSNQSLNIVEELANIVASILWKMVRLSLQMICLLSTPVYFGLFPAGWPITISTRQY
ncbi:F-box protein SKIP23 [Bienertia sinuspersici]